MTIHAATRRELLGGAGVLFAWPFLPKIARAEGDRKSTRLNSSHITISYAVFGLKKKQDHGEFRHPRGRIDTVSERVTGLADHCAGVVGVATALALNVIDLDKGIDERADSGTAGG